VKNPSLQPYRCVEGEPFNGKNRPVFFGKAVKEVKSDIVPGMIILAADIAEARNEKFHRLQTGEVRITG
jgi:hypothetical protein